MAERAQYTNDPDPDTFPTPTAGDGGKALVRNSANDGWEFGEVGGSASSGLTLTAQVADDVTVAIGNKQLFDPSAGGLTVTGPANPSFGDAWGVNNNTTSTAPFTIDGYGIDVYDPSTETWVGSYSAIGAGIDLTYVYDGAQWILSEVGNGETDFVAQVAADITVTIGEKQLYDPSLGGLTVSAPLSPSFGDFWGVNNNTTSVTPFTIDGNGIDIYEPATETWVTDFSIFGAGGSRAPRTRTSRHNRRFCSKVITLLRLSPL